jgi:hypothetical protein
MQRAVNALMIEYAARPDKPYVVFLAIPERAR